MLFFVLCVVLPTVLKKERPRKDDSAVTGRQVVIVLYLGLGMLRHFPLFPDACHREFENDYGVFCRR